jgi:hypothetical protein
LGRRFPTERGNRYAENRGRKSDAPIVSPRGKKSRRDELLDELLREYGGSAEGVRNLVLLASSGETSFEEDVEVHDRGGAFPFMSPTSRRTPPPVPVRFPLARKPALALALAA